MTEDNKVGEVFDYYAESEEGVVNLPFGKDVSDLKELFEVADFFAERYGLGGCRSLEEFVQMVNETDPVVLNMLRSVAIDKNQRELDEINSKTPKRGTMPKTDVKDVKPPQPKQTSRIRTSTVRVKGANSGISRANMKRFLISFGAPTDELDKACTRLDGRKMELRDYGWIDSYALKTMSKEEFREALKNISSDIKASENFEVSDETLRARYRRKG